MAAARLTSWSARLLVASGLALAMGSAVAQAPPHWVASWSTAMLRAPIPANAILDKPQRAPSLSNQTVRQDVRLGIGGGRIRIRLSNAFGGRPLRVSAASVSVEAGEGDALLASSLRALRFDGQASVTIPAGAVRYSDPADLAVHAGDTLGVSLYVAGKVEPSSWNHDALRANRISTAGDYTAAATIPVDRHFNANLWLSGVEVETARPTSVIVALGDSITNGFRASAPDRRYPAVLAQRLSGVQGARCQFAVLNAGIDGNQVAAFESTFGQGQSMRQRFARDVLTQRGARYVLLLGGINDIGEPTMAAARRGKTINGAATATRVIDGLQDIAASAHAAGLRIVGATLPPFAGTQGAYSDQGEQARETVNDWIRHRAPYDAVVDFDAALRDPAQPRRMQPSLDSGDHIHPNDAGYRAMASAIPLALFDCP